MEPGPSLEQVIAALLWVSAFPLATWFLVRLWPVTRRDRLLLGVPVGLAGIAFFLEPSHLGNWYVDIYGHPDAQCIVYQRNPGGASALFPFLSAVVPVGPGAVFLVSRVIGVLSVALIAVVSLHLGTPVLAGAWTALIALDPTMRALFASDARQTWALLWWTISSAAAAQSITAKGSRNRAVFAVLAGLSALLVGFTRIEQAPFVAAIPLIIWGLATPSWKRWVPATALIGAALSVHGLRYAVDARGMTRVSASWERLQVWWDFILNQGTPVPYTDGIFPWMLAGVAVVSLLSRRPMAVAMLAAYLVTALPRVASVFAFVRPGNFFPEMRYDVIGIPLFLGVVAGILATAWRISEKRAVRGALVVVFGVAFVVLPQYRDLRRGAYHLSFQREFVFLREHLHLVPPNASVAVVWSRGFPFDHDSSLAPCHALLTYLRPDIRWVWLRDDQPLPREQADYFFLNAYCSLDAEAVLDYLGPEEGVRKRFGLSKADVRDHLEAHQAFCRALEDATIDWLATVTQEVNSHSFGRFADGKISLGLGRLPNDFWVNALASTTQGTSQKTKSTGSH